MRKPALTPPPTNHRRARATRAASKRADRAEPEKPSPLRAINDQVARWKELHVVATRTKIDLDNVRGDVKAAMIAAGVDHVVTPYGTIPLQQRAGARSIDWEALARSKLSAEEIEQLVPTFTTVGAPSVVLEAPRGWTVEAKSAT